MCAAVSRWPDYIILDYATNDYVVPSNQVPAATFQSKYTTGLNNLLTGTNGSQVLSHATQVVCYGPIRRGSNDPTISTPEPGAPSAVADPITAYYTAIAAAVTSFGNAKVTAFDARPCFVGVSDMSTVLTSDSLSVHPNPAGALLQANYGITPLLPTLFRRSLDTGRPGSRSIK